MTLVRKQVNGKIVSVAEATFMLGETASKVV
jgi:hypothetical protein